MRCLALLVVASLILGCATPYAPNSLPGGYSEVQLDKNVFRVTFEGNGYTSQANTEEMALLRSAEVALQNGFTHFQLAGSSSSARQALLPMPSQSTTTGTVSSVGNTAYLRSTTTTTGGTPLLARFPTVVHTVVCYDGRPNTDALVFDAQLVLNSLGPKFKAKKQ